MSRLTCSKSFRDTEDQQQAAGNGRSSQFVFNITHNTKDIDHVSCIFSAVLLRQEFLTDWQGDTHTQIECLAQGRMWGLYCLHVAMVANVSLVYIFLFSSPMNKLHVINHI